MSIFKIWIPERGETIENAETISWPWSEPSEAVERFISKYYTNLGSPSNINVCLLEVDSVGRPCDETQSYNVIRKSEPSFKASKIK